MKPDHFLAASDVPDDAAVGGMIAFVFACFGAGTPDRRPVPEGPKRREDRAETRVAALRRRPAAPAARASERRGAGCDRSCRPRMEFLDSTAERDRPADSHLHQYPDVHLGRCSRGLRDPADVWRALRGPLGRPT